MARFEIKNPLAKRQMNPNDTVVYERPTTYEPRIPFVVVPDSKALMRQRRRSYWRALGCVAMAAVLVLMLVLGVPEPQTAGLKFLLGFGFVAFAVMSIHCVIDAVTAHDNDRDFSPGQNRRF